MNQTNWQQSPFQPKPKTAAKTVSFVEALKNIGGQTVSTLKNDVILGTTKDSVNLMMGGPSSQPKQTENPWATEWLPQQETDFSREMQRREHHREVTQIKVFDRNEEEIKKEIKELQDQLKALAKDMAGLSQSMSSAIEGEITSPGTYHLSFFEKLKQAIITLRKQVQDSQSWLEMSYARKKAQNSYWSGFKKSGTKFSLSSERYMATSSG